jgi:YgiT-type zinc finger domain-containing protein
MSILLCDNCGKESARIRHVTRSYGKGDSLLIIENIPIMSCPHCEVSYMTAETLHEIARIKLHKKAIAVEKTIPVAEFA